jgi:Mpv17 / PMP22 family
MQAPYLAGFYLYTGLLEGKTGPQILERTREKWWDTYVASSIFWPIANTINFVAVRPHHRILYVGAVGVTWNIYLSWQEGLKDAIKNDCSKKV